MSQCPATARTLVCHLIAELPHRVHVDASNGGMKVWSLPDEAAFQDKLCVPADPLLDAPEALRVAS